MSLMGLVSRVTPVHTAMRIHSHVVATGSLTLGGRPCPAPFNIRSKDIATCSGDTPDRLHGSRPGIGTPSPGKGPPSIVDILSHPPPTPPLPNRVPSEKGCHTSWGSRSRAVSGGILRNDSETGEFCRNLPGGGYRAGMTPHPAEIVTAGERHAAAGRGARVRVSQPSTPDPPGVLPHCRSG
jgi:hypothetical protein